MSARQCASANASLPTANVPQPVGRLPQPIGLAPDGEFVRVVLAQLPRSLPSIELIERKLADADISMEDDSQ